MNMSDDDLKTYLPAYGDCVAVFSFSRSRAANPLSLGMECETLPNVVQRVRDRLMEQKRDVNYGHGTAGKQRKKQTNKNAVKSSRRIEFGWMCYDFNSSKFHQVRQQQGGGTRHLNVAKELTMAEIKQIGIQLFFSSGLSRKGSVDLFNFEICDFSENTLQDDDTVEEVYNRTKVKMLRLYLCSTKESGNNTCNDTANSPKRSDVMDSPSHAMQLRSDEDYLPDIASCESQTMMSKRSDVMDSPSHAMQLISDEDYLPDIASCECQTMMSKRSDVMDSPSHAMQLISDEDYLPDIESLTMYVSEEGHEMESNMDGPSGSVASGGTCFYNSYISLLCSDSETDDESLQSALLASCHQEESVSICDKSAKHEMQSCTKDLIKKFSMEYFAGSNEETCTVIVQRRNFMHSVMRAVNKTGFDFKKRIKVVFSGEEAEDLGGPSRVFFVLLLQAIATEMGLFEGHHEARVFTHNIDLLRRDQYNLAGKMMAWSLANGGPGLGCISSYMYDLWCGSGVDNLEAAAEHVYDDTCKCLVKEMLAVQSESQMETVKRKSWEVLLANGIPNVHALHLGDKYTLVEDLLRNYLHYRLSAELTAFSSGMGMLWNVVEANKDVLKSLFVYENSPLSLLQLRKLYCVEWAENGSKRRAIQEDTIYYFESFLQECEDNRSGVELSQVLAFWTGAKSEPPLGFPAPSVLDDWNTSRRPLTVSFFGEQGRLPYASTCGLRLWLPLNVSQDQFNDLLKRSLTECIGFGKV